MARLVKAFGPEILSNSGRLRRRKLGAIAFSTLENRKKLNSLIHPPLLKELARQTKLAAKSNKLIIIDAALLIDWNWQDKVDYTILVHANENIRIARLKKKGLSEKEARLRSRSQIPSSVQRKFADYVITNNKSIDSLAVQVEKIICKLAAKGLTLPAKVIYSRQLC